MPPPAEKAKHDLLLAARRYLELTAGPVAGPVSVVVAAGLAVVVSEPPSAAPRPAIPEGLTPLQRDLAAALGPTPKAPKQLARESGHPYGSHIRKALAQLADLRIARRTSHGYAREAH